jgi:CBS domain-containing protein
MASTAREIMTENPETIDAEATITDAARLLAEGDIGVLPVCGADRHLEGMLTDRDIVIGVVAAGKDPSSTKVRDVVGRTEVVTIGADDSIDETLRTMKEHKVRRLPVIDGTKLVGIISQGDVATSIPEARVGDLVEAISAAP